jgi:putative ABC transport system permease protein
MIIAEVFKMAINAIWAHKLRSFLTLVGIIAGVASIIGVMTGISVIQNTMEQELSVLGSTVFQVQKELTGSHSRAEWIKASKRPPTTTWHADAIRENIESVSMVGVELWSYGHKLKYREKSVDGQVVVCGGSPEYGPNNTHWVVHGRTVSNEDLKIGRAVVVLGYALAQDLFPFVDPIHKQVKLDGRKFTVIGVFGEKKSSFGGGYDNYALIPISLFKKLYGLREEDGDLRSTMITVRVKSPELFEDAKAETVALMRRLNGLKANEEDNFTIRSSEQSIRQFNDTTAGIKTGAFVIGIVALVVAGIGIMNIMMVSVTERTREIGVRKALGARRKSILMQFLFEAITLCNIGGVIGVAVGFALGNIASFAFNFDASIPMDWALIGLIFCTGVGLIFGFWPAVKASKLIPVESLRYE